MKNKKIPQCRNNSKIKIVERGKIDTSSTQIHDRSFLWYGTGISINSGGVKDREVLTTSGLILISLRDMEPRLILVVLLRPFDLLVLKRRVPLVEQELLTLLELLSSPPGF
jgi:hypothetical protein